MNDKNNTTVKELLHLAEVAFDDLKYKEFFRLLEAAKERTEEIVLYGWKDKVNKTILEKPYYKHDCPTYEQIGHTSTGQDVYFCDNGHHKTLLVRYSDDLDDYQCVYYPPNGRLEGHTEAWKIMQSKGYSI